MSMSWCRGQQLVSWTTTVERVFADAGDSSETARPADAAIASATFALRVNFM